MTDTCFDTGIIVDTLSGHHQAVAELRRVKRPWISRITWLEVMAQVPAECREETERFLANFAIREITPEIHASRATFWNRMRWRLALFLVVAVDYTVNRRFNLIR